MDGLHKIYSLDQWIRSKNNITAEMNIFYDIDSANVYSQALKIKEYDNFLEQAAKKIKNEKDISMFQWLGVDGLITKSKLNIPYKYVRIDKNLFIYHLPYFGNIWQVDVKTLRPVTILEARKEHSNISYVIDLKQEGDVVIFRNKFYYFEVFVNGEKHDYDNFYSFYRINNLEKGIHTISINLSRELILK